MFALSKTVADAVQLVSDTHEFRFQASDGKLRYADAPDAVTKNVK